MEEVGRRGEFFSVSLQALDQIAAQGGQAEEVLGYIVLARHATGKVPDLGRSTSAGAFALQKKAGVSRRTAEAALAWLQEHQVPPHDGSSRHFIADAEEARGLFGAELVPKRFGDSKSSGHQTKVRWWLNPFDKPLYLANALTDGIGKGKENPPLTRIYNDVRANAEAGISMRQARLDAAMLLVHLYDHHAFEECGGVDPRSGLYREWRLATSDEGMDWLGGAPVMALEGTNAAIYEVCGESTVMWLEFAREALSYVSEVEERKCRFWLAFHNLHNLGFLYEVLTIWSADPTDKDEKKRKQAELLYTLYIFDGRARAKEPYVQREIHAMALRRGEIDPMEMGFGPYGTDDTIIDSGRFRFIAVKKLGAHPLGVFRLRYRAKDRDAGRGIAAEERRCLHWANSARRLAGSPQMPSWEQPAIANPA